MGDPEIPYAIAEHRTLLDYKEASSPQSQPRLVHNTLGNSRSVSLLNHELDP